MKLLLIPFEGVIVGLIIFARIVKVFTSRFRMAEGATFALLLGVLGLSKTGSSANQEPYCQDRRRQS